MDRHALTTNRINPLSDLPPAGDVAHVLGEAVERQCGVVPYAGAAKHRGESAQRRWAHRLRPISEDGAAEAQAFDQLGAHLCRRDERSVPGIS